MKILKIAQQVPNEYIPRRDTKVIGSRLLTNTTGGHNKEYIVRLYYYPQISGNCYAVIGHSGGIGQRLTMRFKGAYSNYNFAWRSYIEQIRIRSNAPHNYISDPVHGNGYLRRDLPGEQRITSIEEIRQIPHPPSPPSQQPVSQPSQQPVSQPSQQPVPQPPQQPASQSSQPQPELPSKIRLTRIKGKYNPASSLEILAMHKDYGDLYELYYSEINIETSQKIKESTILSWSSYDKAKKTMDEFIEKAKEKGYEDSNSLLYIPEEANSSNFDFVLNDWKIKKAFKNNSWYKNSLDNRSGKFKIKIASYNNDYSLGNIWWKGYGKNVEIINHDIDQSVFDKNLNKIMDLTEKESLK